MLSQSSLLSWKYVSDFVFILIIDSCCPPLPLNKCYQFWEFFLVNEVLKNNRNTVFSEEKVPAVRSIVGTLLNDVIAFRSRSLRLINICHFFFLFSASGSSTVAIDNKIEQAMVCVIFFPSSDVLLFKMLLHLPSVKKI